MENLMESNWVEVKLDVDPTILESCSAGFFALGCEGINELPGQVVLYFNEAGWQADIPEKIKLVLNDMGQNSSAVALTVTRFPAENWNENWKENFRTFHMGQNIVIRPEWESYQAQKGEQVVVINPKMAFGTGHHETTRLILEHLETMDLSGKSVLDAGTGSAILAIYAALRGAKEIIAFDNDPVAIENAIENAGLNAVADRMDIRCCDITGVLPHPYDIILANINRNVLLTLNDVFVKYAHTGSLLVLSGLLESDETTIRPVYEKSGWQFLRKTGQGEWICLVWQAPAKL